MEERTKRLATALIIIGISGMLAMPPVQLAIGESLDSTTLRDKLLQFVNDWVLEVSNGSSVDQSAAMKAAWNLGSAIKSHQLSSMGVPFTWQNTFNFSNSADYFGQFIMTSDEVQDNLRNYIFELLYSDIQAACDVSVLDILLFRVFDSIIIDWLNLSFGGFCNGFSQAARDYFRDSEKIPLGLDYAHDLPPPNPNETIARETHGDVTESAIKEYVLWKGSAAFFNPNHLLNWLKIYLGLPSPQGGITNAEQVQLLMADMGVGTPNYQPGVVLLMAPFWDESDPGKSHFVNVYDYDVNSNGSITLYIYNNWYIYDSTWTKYDDWILIDANGNFHGTHLAPEENFTRICYYPPTAEYNSIIGALIDLLPQLIGFGIFSPVDIKVTDPLGRTVSIDQYGNMKQEFPAVLVESNGEKELLFPYTPGLPYTVNLTGTDNGDYRFEINRMVGRRLVTNVINGTTKTGQNDLYTVTLDQSGVSVAEMGVYLQAPTILSGNSVQLTWDEFNNDNLDFESYQIYVSTKPNEMGTLYGDPITDIATTSAVVGGLTGQTTYFFTVRVTTAGNVTYDSNGVGATLPQDFTFWLIVAAGITGVAILLVLVVVFRRRRS